MKFVRLLPALLLTCGSSFAQSQSGNYGNMMGGGMNAFAMQDPTKCLNINIFVQSCVCNQSPQGNCSALAQAAGQVPWSAPASAQGNGSSSNSIPTGNVLTCTRAMVPGTCSAGNGFTGDSCQDATKNMHTAASDFSTACGKANMNQSGDSNSFACSNQVLSCENCQPSDDDDDDSGAVGNGHVNCKDKSSKTSSSRLDAGSLTSGNFGSSTSKKSSFAPDADAAQQMFNNCPALAGEGLDDYRSKVRDSQKQVLTLQNDLAKAKEELAKLGTDYQKQMNDQQNQMLKTRNDAQDQIKKIQQSMKDEQRQIAGQVAQLNSHMSGLYAQIGQVQVQRAKNSEKLNEYRIQELNKCHAESLAKVNALRNQKLALMNNGSYSAGGLNSLLQSVGLDSRTQSQKLTLQYDLWCQQDSTFLNDIQISQQQYGVDTTSADKQQEALEQQITEDRNQISQLQSEVPQDNQQALQDMSDAQNRMVEELDNLMSQQKTAASEYQSQYMSKVQEIQSKTQELAEEQDFLNQNQNYLAAASQPARGISSDKGSVQDAISKFNSYNGTVEDYLGACCIGGGGGGSDCQKKAKFYCANMGGDCGTYQCIADGNCNGNGNGGAAVRGLASGGHNATSTSAAPTSGTTNGASAPAGQ